MSGREGYFLSTDPARLDRAFIVRSLQTTYWAGQRTPETIWTAFQNALPFGIYEKETGKQVACCRLVTDQVTFSWLADVFVDPAHRGRGLGKWLVEAVVAHPVAARTNITLGTRDAHGLYTRYGFHPVEHLKRPAGG